jgi:hypothetical protein
MGTIGLLSRPLTEPEQIKQDPTRIANAFFSFCFRNPLAAKVAQTDTILYSYQNIPDLAFPATHGTK